MPSVDMIEKNIESKPNVIIISDNKKRKRGVEKTSKKNIIGGGCDSGRDFSPAETTQKSAYKKLKAEVNRDLQASVSVNKKLQEFDIKLQEINDEIFFMNLDLFFSSRNE
jgi:hypothetical protein